MVRYEDPERGSQSEGNLFTAFALHKTKLLVEFCPILPDFFGRFVTQVPVLIQAILQECTKLTCRIRRSLQLCVRRLMFKVVAASTIAISFQVSISGQTFGKPFIVEPCAQLVKSRRGHLLHGSHSVCKCEASSPKQQSTVSSSTAATKVQFGAGCASKGCISATE